MFVGETLNLEMHTIWRYLARRTGGDATDLIAKGAPQASGCGHAVAGVAIAAIAAIRRRSVSAQDRLSASACNRQTARTLSRPCTRKGHSAVFDNAVCPLGQLAS